MGTWMRAGPAFVAVLALAVAGCSGGDDETVKTWTIGGTVAGLAGSGLVLATPGQADLAVAAGQTSFRFATAVEGGTAYAVTVSTQPGGQSCAVANGTGTVGDADVTSVAVTCAPLGAWALTGFLAVPRSAFTTTVLATGEVLVAGGEVNSTGGAWAATATAERYDPVTGTWTTVAPMGTARRWACAARLASGEVLVAGGDNPDGILATAEVYDPVADAWTPTTGSMAAGRLLATCTRLASGEVLVAGGAVTGAAQASADRYDPATGLFTATQAMAAGRFFHSATILSSGEVLVVGGCSTNPCFTTTAAAERYDPVAGSWSDAGVLPGNFGVGGHAATLLPGGEVLVAGGCHVGNGTCPDTADQRHLSLFQPAGPTWTGLGPLAVGRTMGAALLVPGGDVLVAAGDYHGLTKQTTERYLQASRGLVEGPGTAAFHGNRVGWAPLDGGRWLLVGGLLSAVGGNVQNSGAAEIFSE
jgi:hypothetical protein